MGSEESRMRVVLKFAGLILAGAGLGFVASLLVPRKANQAAYLTR